MYDIDTHVCLFYFLVNENCYNNLIIYFHRIENQERMIEFVLKMPRKICITIIELRFIMFIFLQRFNEVSITSQVKQSSSQLDVLFRCVDGMANCSKLPNFLIFPFSLFLSYYTCIWSTCKYNIFLFRIILFKF